MSSKKSDKEKESNLKKVGWFALKTAGISAAVLGGVAVAVPVIGFTAGGVAAGSLAAAYQSAVLGGTIASGSAFALLQSVGVLGLAASTQAGVVAGSAAVAGLHTILKKNNNNDENSNSDDEGKKINCTDTAVLKKNLNEVSDSNTDLMEQSETNETNNGGKETQSINLRCNCDKAAAEILENVKETSCEELMKISSDNNSDRKKSQSINLNDCHCAEVNKQNASKKRKMDIQEMDFTPEPQIDPRWKAMQLTDDITITNHILKKKYPKVTSINTILKKNLNGLKYLK